MEGCEDVKRDTNFVDFTSQTPFYWHIHCCGWPSLLVSCEVYTSFASCYYISKTEDLKFVFLLVVLKTVEIMFQGKIVVNRITQGKDQFSQTYMDHIKSSV